MTVALKRFDAAEHILDDQDARFFLEAALVDSTPEHIASALDAVIRAKGLMALARETGLSRDQIGDILNPWGGKTDHQELLKLCEALGVSAANKSDAA